MRVRRTLLHFDSKCRNFKLYPDTKHYAIKYDLRHVVRVNLTELYFQLPPTTVASNIVQYESEGIVHTVKVPVKHYTRRELLETLRKALGQGFHVSYEHGRVGIRSETEVRFLFNSGSHFAHSLHPYLGFTDADTECGIEHRANFEMQMPLSHYLDVSIAELPEAACKKAVRRRQNLTDFTARPELQAESIVARIPLGLQLDETPNDAIMYRATAEDLMQEYFRPSTFGQLTFSFRDQYGHPISIGEHSLTLLCEICLPDPNRAPPQAAVKPGPVKPREALVAPRLPERDKVHTALLLSIAAVLWLGAVGWLLGLIPGATQMGV